MFLVMFLVIVYSFYIYNKTVKSNNNITKFRLLMHLMCVWGMFIVLFYVNKFYPFCDGRVLAWGIWLCGIEVAYFNIIKLPSKKLSQETDTKEKIRLFVFVLVVSLVAPVFQMYALYKANKLMHENAVNVRTDYKNREFLIVRTLKTAKKRLLNKEEIDLLVFFLKTDINLKIKKEIIFALPQAENSEQALNALIELLDNKETMFKNGKIYFYISEVLSNFDRKEAIEPMRKFLIHLELNPNVYAEVRESLMKRLRIYLDKLK
ncbi:MAG: hypothetical protein L6416_01695 [Candidatus Omnitrophica bacterium]|nr:hypothetical protein [Candidatus Omnitrophota bacterium]